MDEPNAKSDILQNTPQIPKETSAKTVQEPAKKYSYYTYFLAFIVVCLILVFLYYKYKCFQSNRCTKIQQPFVIRQPRSDTQTDKSFDMDEEVRKLTMMQEKYLKSLNEN